MIQSQDGSGNFQPKLMILFSGVSADFSTATGRFKICYFIQITALVTIHGIDYDNKSDVRY